MTSAERSPSGEKNDADVCEIEIGAMPSPSQVRSEEAESITKDNTDWTAKLLQHQIKRYATRKVKLVQGSVLSIDYPVPSAIQNAIDRRYRLDPDGATEEFTHMRYTAATCDPDDFTLKNGYNLRPAMFNRHTELLVGITYFCEDKKLFARTLHSVMQNVRDIVNLKRTEFWNKGGPTWQKIVVCLLFDGIEPCDTEVLDVLATIGIYQDGIMKKDVDGVETVAHIFEYTTQLSITEYQQLIRPSEASSDIPPVQLILCLKQRNRGKTSSHRWLFNGLGRILNPEVVVCIDVGTKLDPKSLLTMWEAFYNHKDVGGACGEVSPDLGLGWKNLLNPIVAAQYFEYKISSGLDKPMESFFGYMTVLPGAFSAYRFRAVMGRPLHQYCHGDLTLATRLGKKGIEGMNIFKKNMFLAEDRILCLELVVKAGSKWRSRYVAAAKGQTDVPEGVVDFITQRRRWLNGAFAATVYSIMHFPRIYKSGHSIVRMFLFHIQIVYIFVSFILSWFNLATFLLTMFIVTDLSSSPPEDSNIKAWPFQSATPVFNTVIQTVYLITVIYQFILALGSRPRGHVFTYVTSFGIFGILQIYFAMNVVYLMKVAIQDQKQASEGKSYTYISTFYLEVGKTTVWIACAAVFGVYYAAAFINLDFWHMFVAYPQYLFVASSYTNILNVYAFSNTHDYSWGGKAEADRVSQLDSLRTANLRVENGVVVDKTAPSDSLQSDIDAKFEATVRRALAPYKAPRHRDEKILMDVHNGFRTKLVAIYIFTNFLLCIFVMNDSFDKFKFLGNSRQHKIWFFRVWMWTTSGCFGLRFAGFLMYTVNRVVHCCFARR